MKLASTTASASLARIHNRQMWYRQISPHYWTADHVLDWISDHVESTKFDASTLILDYCAIDGPALCQMDQDQMIAAFGPQLGSHLYQSLQEQKTKYGNLHLSYTVKYVHI